MSAADRDGPATLPRRGRRALGSAPGAPKPLERVAIEPIGRPVAHRPGAERLIERDRRRVPVEHRPLHPPAAALHRQTAEAGQQGLTLFAFDRWRLAWDAADAATREAIRINTQLYDGIWDGMYMVLLVGFAIGNACLGSALIAAGGLARAVGGFMLAACALTVALFFNELKLPLLPAAVLDASYPAIQPLGRALIGVWLWRMSRAAP